MLEFYTILALWGPPPAPPPHGGHMYLLNNFESPTPIKDNPYQVWLKSDHDFQEEDENVKSLRTTDLNSRFFRLLLYCQGMISGFSVIEFVSHKYDVLK